jgi:hypothetical protein
LGRLPDTFFADYALKDPIHLSDICHTQHPEEKSLLTKQLRVGYLATGFCVLREAIRRLTDSIRTPVPPAVRAHFYKRIIVEYGSGVWTAGIAIWILF